MVIQFFASRMESIKFDFLLRITKLGNIRTSFFLKRTITGSLSTNFSKCSSPILENNTTSWP